MIVVNHRISLDESELQLEYIRASGPGGQNVNKVATAVQLKFDVRGSRSLPDAVRERLIALAGRRVGADGVLTIQARRHRTQEGNRQDAVERLVALIREACVRPKARHETKPTRASRERRLESKRQRSETKSRRRSTGPGDEG